MTFFEWYHTISTPLRDASMLGYWTRFTTAIDQKIVVRGFIAITVLSTLIYLLHRHLSYNDDLPTVNRRFTLEPRLFARWRWAFRSDKILDEAYAKVCIAPYVEGTANSDSSTKGVHIG
jgi:hypothetical protein